MQFDFMLRCVTTNAMFISRQVQNKYLAKKTNKSKLCFAFADLEIAFDGVSRVVVRWVLRKLDVEGWLVKVVLNRETKFNLLLPLETISVAIPFRCCIMGSGLGLLTRKIILVMTVVVESRITN